MEEEKESMEEIIDSAIHKNLYKAISGQHGEWVARKSVDSGLYEEFVSDMVDNIRHFAECLSMRQEREKLGKG